MSTGDEWPDQLADTGELTPEIVDRIIAIHGSRGTRAIEAVAEERVKQYLDFRVVVGHTEEYVIEDGACNCEDSQYNLATDDPTERCWHGIASEIAEKMGAVDHHDMWYSEVREFL